MKSGNVFDVGECEKATKETTLVTTQMCSSYRYLRLAHQTASLEHNLSWDYISAMIKLH